MIEVPEPTPLGLALRHFAEALHQIGIRELPDVADDELRMFPLSGDELAQALTRLATSELVRRADLPELLLRTLEVESSDASGVEKDRVDTFAVAGASRRAVDRRFEEREHQVLRRLWGSVVAPTAEGQCHDRSVFRVELVGGKVGANAAVEKQGLLAPGYGAEEKRKRSRVEKRVDQRILGVLKAVRLLRANVGGDDHRRNLERAEFELLVAQARAQEVRKEAAKGGGVADRLVAKGTKEMPPLEPPSRLERLLAGRHLGDREVCESCPHLPGLDTG